ncbi:hypothetical protein AVEN_163929-1 [Araneus ventricosus]|uniref:Uncharacterized protein n=1 Tax=Araneus ventricosus TaxID=182803 RepID=A0A4Y2MG55_ARAVE|nr:hypothetical protein AVEN_163929-1 [Araneus ventricosus]
MKGHSLILIVITKIIEALVPVVHQAVNTLFVEFAWLGLKPISSCVHDSFPCKSGDLSMPFSAEQRCECHMVKDWGCMASFPTLSTQTYSTCSVGELPYVVAHYHGAKPLYRTTGRFTETVRGNSNTFCH